MINLACLCVQGFNQSSIRDWYW